MAELVGIPQYTISAADDFNKIGTALANACGLADSTATFIRPGTAYLGTPSVYLTRDASTNLVLADGIMGAKTLATIAGSAQQPPVPEYAGYFGVGVGLGRGSAGRGHPIANRTYLTPIVTYRNNLVFTGARIHQFSGAGTGSAYAGLYDTGGTLIGSSNVAAVGTGPQTVNFISSATVLADRYWLAVQVNSVATAREFALPGYSYDYPTPSIMKYVDAGSFGLGGTITIPATRIARASQRCGAIGVVNGGIF